MKKAALVVLFVAFLCAIGVGAFFLLANGHVSPTVFIIGLGVVGLVLFLGKDGVIIPDRNGNAHIYTVRSWVRDRHDALRWWFDQRRNTLNGQRYKTNLRRVVSHLAKHGATTVDTLAFRLDAPSDEVAEWVRDLVARRWIAECLTGEEEEVPVYAATERGLRDLASPGSTDHEPR